MLRPRIIPCLLIHAGGLVKTVGFRRPVYVGDPINAVKIFNEKESDELIVVDIDATVTGVEPDYRTIAHLAAECRMPLCYGGGIKNADQARRIVGLGVEKVAVSSAAVHRPELVTEIAEKVGCQSMVVVMDVKKRRFSADYELVTHNATRTVRVDPVSFARDMMARGAGELVINSVDNDGVMGGYDLSLPARIKEATTIPITVLGGAGSLDHLSEAIAKVGTIGLAAGSMFVFKGKLRAVLINYPSGAAKEALIQDALSHTAVSRGRESN